MRSADDVSDLGVVLSPGFRRDLAGVRPVLVTALLVALTSALAAPEVRAQQFFSVFASLGQGSAQVDVPVGPSPAEKEFDDEGSSVFYLPSGEVDAFGVLSWSLTGDFDPYFATRVRITNLESSAQPIGFSVLMPMQAVLTPATPPFSTFTGSFTASLTDTSGDLIASYTGGGAGFSLSDVLGASLTPNHTVDLTAPGMAVVYDIPSLTVPSSFTGQWTRMGLAHFANFPTVSSLSPGDSVEFYVFGCVALPATTCPTPPALPLPEPGVSVSLGTGLMLIAAARRRRRRGPRKGLAR